MAGGGRGRTRTRSPVLATLLGTALAVATLLSGATAVGHGAPAAGAATVAPRSARVPGRAGVPAFHHVFVVVMENLGYDATLATPGFAALAHRYALATQYYAVAHPSLPNYLALASGGTWGVTSDCTSCYVSVRNLATELAAAHVSFGAYMEGLGHRCDLSTSTPANYAIRHDPFAYFTDVRAHAALCAHILPEAGLPRLLAGPAGGVPRFVWVTPNVCHDGHNCPATQAATWLRGFVAGLTRSAAWRDGGVLFVTWDENPGDYRIVARSGAISQCCGGGHVATLVLAPHLRAGLKVATPYTHYSLLATIEDAFGLPLLGNARGATPLAAFFRAASRAR